MKLNGWLLPNPIIVVGVLAVGTLCANSQSQENALVRFSQLGDFDSLSMEIDSMKSRNQFPAQLVDALSENNSASPEARSATKRNLEWVLLREVTDATYSDYVAMADSAGISEEIRKILFRSLIEGASRLTQLHRLEVFHYLKSSAGQEGLPISTRAFILKNLGSFPTQQDETAYLPFFASPDSNLRSAAYQGLAALIRRNRMVIPNPNQELFNRVVPHLGATLDLDEVRMLATFSANYARDYLLLKCENDPVLVREVFKYDESLSHPGLVAEALRLAGGAQREAMIAALRYGLKNPASLSEGWLAGTEPEIVRGIELLKVFPEHIPAQRPAIEALKEAANEEVRLAAERVLTLTSSSEGD